MAIPKKMTPKLPEECVLVKVELCGEAKKKVLEFQGDYLKSTGIHIGKERAIIKLLTK